MTARYTIRADVVDIRRDRPRATDKILVDTNVWYWYSYNEARFSHQPPKSYQLKQYPEYVFKASKSKRASLFYCGLSLSELAHLIEQAEHSIFDPGGLIANKDYRHNYAAERRNVMAKIRTSWSKVKNIASPLEVLVSGSSTDTALARLDRAQIDGYDAFFLEAMEKASLNQILTDDGDFVTVPGIQVFTANQNVLDAAQTQGKLLAR